MAERKFDDQFSDEEAQRRFEAALRGAREVGHEPMKDIPTKRPKPHSEMKLGKSKAKRKPGKPSPAVLNKADRYRLRSILARFQRKP